MEVKYAMPYINNMDYTVPTQAWSWTTLHNRHSILAFNNAWWLFLIRLKGHLPIRTSKKNVDAILIQNWSPFGPNSLSIYMDDPDSSVTCHLLPGQSFQSELPKHGWGKTNKWSFSVPQFHELFSNIWKFENKNIRFLLVFPFVFSRRKHSKNSRLLLPPKHLIFQSQKRHCLSDDGRDDSRWKISLSEAFGGRGKQLEWRQFYRVLWEGASLGTTWIFLKMKKTLMDLSSACFLLGKKTKNHRSLRHSSNCYAWKGFAESFLKKTPYEIDST